MVNCKVLSIIKSEHVDAYLLSESSMFVFPHKIILKTCGTTTLLLGLHRLLHIAANDAGFPFHNAKSLEDIKAAATPYRVFYSRKNFLFPDRQRGPHRGWKQEVRFLDDMFEGGSAYMVGKMNGDHWYLYITSPNTTITPPRTPDEDMAAPRPSSMRTVKIPTALLSSFQSVSENNSDETLEILMTDLDPGHAKQFYLSHASAVANESVSAQAQQARPDAPAGLGNLSSMDVGIGPTLSDRSHDAGLDIFGDVSEQELLGNQTREVDQRIVTEALTTEGHALGTAVSDSCGLSDVYPTSTYPDARIDAYLFSPCGFSANGVIPAPLAVEHSQNGESKAAHYFTVHVTPEPNCSFASFETNVPGGQKGRCTADIIEHVVRIFQPGRFSVTLFEAKNTNSYKFSETDHRVNGGIVTMQRMEKISGYRRIDRIVHDFDDYDLVFRYYEREGWVGDGGARVGEEM